MAIKINDSENYENLFIYLTKEKYPIAYGNKLAELIRSGMSQEDAEYYIETTPIELELYYEQDSGLFAVESEAVESGGIVSPYSQEPLESIE